MKRIKAACLLQTVHFLLKEDMPHDAAVNAVKGEVAQYKAHLERNRTKSGSRRRRRSRTARSSSRFASSTTSTAREIISTDRQKTKDLPQKFFILR